MELLDSVAPRGIFLSIMKIDSHHHLWAINETDYVWMTEDHAKIRRDFLPEHAASHFQAAGIDGSVVVQARQMIEETEWLLGLAEANDWMRGVVGWVPLKENAGEPFLECFAAHTAHAQIGQQALKLLSQGTLPLLNDSGQRLIKA